VKDKRFIREEREPAGRRQIAAGSKDDLVGIHEIFSCQLELCSFAALVD
jgi:hypothetical protein